MILGVPYTQYKLITEYEGRGCIIIYDVVMLMLLHGFKSYYIKTIKHRFREEFRFRRLTHVHTFIGFLQQIDRSQYSLKRLFLEIVVIDKIPTFILVQLPYKSDYFLLSYCSFSAW